MESVKLFNIFREGNCNDLKSEVEGKVQDIVTTHKAKVSGSCFRTGECLTFLEPRQGLWSSAGGKYVHCGTWFVSET